jgi:hypothetical protein
MTDLRDYRWIIEGEAQVADIILNNPSFMVNTVYYKAQEKVADIELLFWEGDGIYRHSRIFSIEVIGETEGLDRDTVASVINNLFPNANQIV